MEALENNAKLVIKIYKIMINSIKVIDFDKSNRIQFIKYIKVLNTKVQDLQMINIKWISWRNVPKPGQELALLVIKFWKPEHMNASLDYNIMISWIVYIRFVSYKEFKFMQYF